MDGERPSGVMPRHPANLLIGSPDGSLPLSCTRDLSLSGVFLETDSRPPLGSVHEITFVWGDDTYECRARVARYAPDGVGLAFVDPEPLLTQALEEIIASAG